MQSLNGVFCQAGVPRVSRLPQNLRYFYPQAPPGTDLWDLQALPMSHNHLQVTKSLPAPCWPAAKEAGNEAGIRAPAQPSPDESLYHPTDMEHSREVGNI